MTAPLLPDMIALAALKRSGHHAFIVWLAQAGLDFVHLNNVRPSWPPQPDGAEVPGQANDARAPVALAAFRRGQRPAGRCIANYEGVLGETFAGQLMQLRRGGEVAAWLFLRDPLNGFASIARRLQSGQRSNRLAAALQGLAFVDAMAALDTAQPTYARVIHFTPWLHSDAYRGALASELGLTDRGVPRDITAYGGGSSFGAEAGDVAARETRWRIMQDDPFFLAYFADADIAAAVRHYFAQFGEGSGPADAEMLIGRAAANGEAKALSAQWFASLSRLRPAALAMEQEAFGLRRKLRRMGLRRALRDPVQHAEFA